MATAPFVPRCTTYLFRSLASVRRRSGYRPPGLGIACSRPVWQMGDPGLWDAAQGAFYGSSLHQSIVARGWTIKDFARASQLDPGSIYGAIRGRRVRDATAIRIFETLERRRPMTVVRE